jgi:formylglycine-generating enzyme required for sulfatase activity
VALTREPEGMVFFINGEKQGDPLPVALLGPDKPLRLCLKGNPERRDVPYVGDVDEVRVSSIIRYRDNFTPKNRFEPDADTIALYHFDEGQGDVLTDSSGKNRHGKIEGAKRVPSGNPIPAYTNALGMQFALVPKGKSWLGGGGGQAGTTAVEFKDDFYLGVYEVTQEEWEKVTGSTPSSSKVVEGVTTEEMKRFPVETVSWDDCQHFIEQLTDSLKEPGWIYRLPKQAEWEYACRGGPLENQSAAAFHFYLQKPTDELRPEQANYGHGAGLKRTCKVGTYPPNPVGLFDMHGNVWEWCDDAEQTVDGDCRVNRGGSWWWDSVHCRAAYRSANPPSTRWERLGLRLARVRAPQAAADADLD